MFKEQSTEEIINLVLDDDKELNKNMENFSKTIDEACENYANEQCLNVQTDYLDININNDGLIIKVKKEDNHTLGDLKQKIINNLYDMKNYGPNDVELVKILFENE